MYRLDRKAFRAMTAEEADTAMKNYHNFSLVERFRAAYYLISVSFNFPLDDPPRLDRTAFEKRGRNG
jgi:hypothetical protein